MRAYGTVEQAMREAITHTFNATSFSFFSEAQTIEHYKFNIQELQSYILFKNKGRANKEMMHVMHYHGVECVPLFREHMEKVYTRDADEPQRLKFLANTPLALRQGFNMLMPVPANAAADEGVNASGASIELPEETTVLEAPLNDSTRPEPPDEPIIEKYEEEEEESINVAGENDPVIEYAGEKGGDERVTSGPVRGEHQPSQPIILEPARPPAVVLKAKSKQVSRPPEGADVRDRPEGSTSATSTSNIAPKARPSAPVW